MKWRDILADDRGSASVVTAGIIAALMGLLLTVAGLASVVVARHEAQVAADVAAVAGAFAVYRGEKGCAVAADIAKRNGAGIAACAVEGADVVLTTTVRGSEARARAGPL